VSNAAAFDEQAGMLMKASGSETLNSRLPCGTGCGPAAGYPVGSGGV
jgi:hypothetical protein